ncbi:MAG: fumarylacetoacetate hydrolase family protein [Candidatus Bathycorpusculaceae bacterium]
MKLVRYSLDGKKLYGALIDDKVICLPSLARKFGEKLPRRIEDFIKLGVKGVETAEKLLTKVMEKNYTDVFASVNDVRLLAPIASPPKIICLGLNYRDHAEEQSAPIPEEPVIFMKPHTAIIGPNESIVKPSFVKQLDYEAELAIVIGKKTKNVSVSDAKSHIFGYTILNDVSARDIQFKDKQWTRGKSFDTFAPTGPCITTINQLQDTTNLRIQTWVNNEPRQNSTTQNMVFNVFEIVHHLSQAMTLEPCDLIATGTPSGVGFAMKPKPRFLKHGDVVRIGIEGIGVLENAVVEEKQA